MTEEDEIAGEVDRIVRSASMALSRTAELMDRRRAEESRSAREQIEVDLRAADRQHAEAGRYLRASVDQEAFWSAADGKRIADVATYTASRYQVDANAALAYDTTRQHVFQRFGMNMDAVRALHPDSEQDRHEALRNAIDDCLAREREEHAAALLRDEEAERAAEAKRILDQASQERESQGEEELPASDAPLAEAEAEGELAAAAGAQAQEHEERAGGDHQREKVHAAQAANATAPESVAGRVRMTVETSYPDRANATLRTSMKKTKGNPTPRRTRGPSGQRDSGLSR